MQCSASSILRQTIRHNNCNRPKWSYYQGRRRRCLLCITDNELALKYQEASDVLDTALNESIDSLNKDASIEPDGCFSIAEIEELGPTHELRVGDKIEVY